METLKQHFQRMVKEEQECIDFFTNTGTRLIERDADLKEYLDMTPSVIEESKRRIEMYTGLIARLEAKGVE